MANNRKLYTKQQISDRDDIEKELSSIPIQHPLVAKITSAKGFASYYVRMKDLYNTHADAYERLEEYHYAITGHRRYSEYDSFRVVFKKNEENK
ncbi:MAG: hypothetical protein LKI59_00100 [Bacteroidales bacterium]|jgi:hypothetical protein|nr:hypothetical protein [Bacteroidales bacterium]